MQCPACARPVAVSRPTCLYCGAALPAEAVAQADAARAALDAAGAMSSALRGMPPAPADSEQAEEARARAVVVVETTRADADALGRVLGLSAYEAGQRVRRGGWQLLRVGLPAGNEELAALRATGAQAANLSHDDVSAAQRPEIVAGGTYADDRLELRTLEGRVALVPGALLLVVRGPIVRRAQAGNDARLRVAGHAEPGLRLHLHRRNDPRPLELDPLAFEFGATGAPDGAGVLTLARWVDAVAAGAPIDEGFRHVTPALGPAQPEAYAGAAALDALRASRQRGQNAQAMLDNVAQFRFYSAWRALAERRAGQAAD